MSDNETYPCDDCIYKDRPEKIFQDACDGCHPNGYPYHTKREQMSNKPIPCPYCGDEPESTGSIATCRTKDCPNLGHQMYICKWNRRFVCLATNGDKVFAGDDIKITADDSPHGYKGKASLLGCVPVDGVPMPINFLFEQAVRHKREVIIELIKEDT